MSKNLFHLAGCCLFIGIPAGAQQDVAPPVSTPIQPKIVETLWQQWRQEALQQGKFLSNTSLIFDLASFNAFARQGANAVAYVMANLNKPKLPPAKIKNYFAQKCRKTAVFGAETEILWRFLGQISCFSSCFATKYSLIFAGGNLGEQDRSLGNSIWR